MANRHYELNEEFQVDLTVNVKLERCSDYNHISDEDTEVSALRDQIRQATAELQDAEEAHCEVRRNPAD